jgi:hypothetical protein
MINNPSQAFVAHPVLDFPRLRFLTLGLLAQFERLHGELVEHFARLSVPPAWRERNASLWALPPRPACTRESKRRPRGACCTTSCLAAFRLYRSRFTELSLFALVDPRNAEAEGIRVRMASAFQRPASGN